MGAPIRKWSRSPFRIRLHEKTTKFRYYLIHMLHRLFPPRRHIGIKRVADRKSAQLHRRRKIHTDIQPDAVSGKQIRVLLHLLQVHVSDQKRLLLMDIYIIDGNGICTNRGHETGIHLDPLIVHHLVIVVKK